MQTKSRPQKEGHNNIVSDLLFQSKRKQILAIGNSSLLARDSSSPDLRLLVYRRNLPFSTRHHRHPVITDEYPSTRHPTSELYFAHRTLPLSKHLPCVDLYKGSRSRNATFQD